jgi:hypothetical protein
MLLSLDILFCNSNMLNNQWSCILTAALNNATSLQPSHVFDSLLLRLVS